MENVVRDKRDKEVQSEFKSRKKQPRIEMMAPMLLQESMIYTPAIFEVFLGEYI